MEKADYEFYEQFNILLKPKTLERIIQTVREKKHQGHCQVPLHELNQLLYRLYGEYDKKSTFPQRDPDVAEEQINRIDFWAESNGFGYSFDPPMNYAVFDFQRLVSFWLSKN